MLLHRSLIPLYGVLSAFLAPYLLGVDVAHDPALIEAQVFFHKHDYEAALHAVKDKNTLEALWIKAESLFRQKKFDESRIYFKKINRSSSINDQEKAALRLIEIDVLLARADDALASFNKLDSALKKRALRLTYALGKLLYDRKQFSHAQTILHSIAKDTEFFIRAQYIIAAIALDEPSKENALSLFHAMQTLPAISAEDPGVLAQAILAEARILGEMSRYVEAKNTYARVALDGPYADIAVSELCQLSLQHAQKARLGREPFAQSSLSDRALAQQAALADATQVIERYRNIHGIHIKNPELLLSMGSLLVASKRYDDARGLLNPLINRYRPLRLAFLNDKESIWPVFALDGKDKPQWFLDVPEYFLRDLDVDDILAIRDRTLEQRARLLDLKQRGFSLQDVSFKHAVVTQRALEDAYLRMVIKKQQEFGRKVVATIDSFLALAEVKRADLVIAEMADVEEKRAVISDFQRENITIIEKKVRDLDKGDSP